MLEFFKSSIISMKNCRVQWVIIDEADKMFEGSEEEVDTFRQQLGVVLAALSDTRKLAMFSATHTPALAKWVRRHLRGLITVTVGHRSYSHRHTQMNKINLNVSNIKRTRTAIKLFVFTVPPIMTRLNATFQKCGSGQRRSGVVVLRQRGWEAARLPAARAERLEAASFGFVLFENPTPSWYSDE